jgi:hypothetical protein
MSESRYGAVERCGDDEESAPVYEVSFWGHEASIDYGRRYYVSLASKTFVLVSVLIVALFVLDAANGREGTSILNNFLVTTGRSPMKSTLTVPYASTASGLAVSSVTNEYGDVKASMLPYTFLSGAYLFEPYRETQVTLWGTQTGCTYKWTITSDTDSSNKVSGTVTSGAFKVTLTKVGKYMLEVSDSCTTEVLGQPIWVKYIRRELSNLNDQDREDFLDAFHTLWTVSTLEGQKIYGERYKSLYYFASIHNDGGGNSVCDEFHGGVGFISNHMYLSAYLEQSLQLVNPKVALHYMEYTKYFESDAFDLRKSRYASHTYTSFISPPIPFLFTNRNANTTPPIRICFMPSDCVFFPLIFSFTRF